MAKKDDWKRMMDLYAKPVSYKFNDEEISFIKKNTPKHRFKMYYAVRKKSNKDLYICIILNRAEHSTRKTAAWNSYNIICSRPVTDKEYHDEIMNYGAQHRVLTVWYYKHIDHLIAMDKELNAITPEKFIKFCYDNDYCKPYQMTLGF